ncbi:MAG: hypothetical protein F4112_16145 [Holophagales bacterium]|nr:hypothetical protein [Holophagales bacterium]MYB20829.1 hypothetical protein [Holophagales bacterium]MYH25467.1 hypothetical protein [Holophagales bacterium]MYI34480.1 hypothetical protein [Holophagales bacterium]
MKPEEIRETFRYHSPGPEAVRTHERIRARMTDTAVDVAGMIPPSRERSTFITLMQQAQMMANAAVAIHGLPARAGEAQPAADKSPLPAFAGPDAETAERPNAAAPGRRVVHVPGRVHKATGQQPDFRRQFRWPRHERTAELSVTVIPAEINPDGAQLLWWCMPKHRNLLALALVRRGKLILRTDCGVPHGEKQKFERSCRLRPGGAYRVHCRYEARKGGRLRFSLVDGAGIDVQIDAPVNVGDWPRLPMVLGLGYPRFDDPEVQRHHPLQPGWEWRDLEIAPA